MKKLVFTAASIACFCLGCDKAKTQVNTTAETVVISNGLKFCEGSVAYGTSMLVSNFGTEELKPVNTEGKGYISRIIGKEVQVFIPADGHMNAPKGMAIAGKYLYIADVNKVLVYQLGEKPTYHTTIQLPEGNVFVNDIAINGNWAYISVTNTGKIFKLNITNPAGLSNADLSDYVDVTGANGLLTDGKTLYIASYPADGNTTLDHVIYKISNMGSPVVEKLVTRQGQYDGLALKNNRLYFSNWVDSEIGYVNLLDNKVTVLPIANVKITGPADISLMGNKLYIPNLPSSEIIVIDTQD